MKKFAMSVLAVGVLAAALLVAPPGAVASQSSDAPPTVGAMPSEVPSAATPNITGDNVQSIAAVGSRMIIGGPFTTVGTAARQGLAAFDSTTGAVDSGFNPTVTGSVLRVLPGPVSDTVYVVGNFSVINGTASKKIALLSTVTGALVPTFTPPAFNGEIDDVKLSNGRLFLGGAFTKVGTVARGGLATLNPTTGAFDPFLGVTLTEHHNNTGTGAQAAVAATNIDVSPDGTKMAVIGNFRKADGLDRVQAVLIDLTGPTAVVQTSWNTTGYAPLCSNSAFDTYVRGVAFAPDSSYFVITATGGPHGGTLCDAAARWETGATGTDVQPTWVNQTGGDTLWAVTVTSSAVFIGGHQRWLNNPTGADFANGGAVPRPGLAALDPVSGRPLTWNPGRNPRGVAVFSMLATTKGLWITYNTDFIGNRKYKRQKLAFFPYAGGTTLAPTTVPTLPATVYVGHGDQGAASNVLYRVNTGGSLVPALDSGPDWSDDSGASSALRNSGSNSAGYPQVGAVDATVPATTPSTIFNSERWDPNDPTEMQWHFPVTAGVKVQVRIFLANRCDCTSGVGQRVFNIDVDGLRKLTNEDLVADVGTNVGTMKAYDITSDGTVDITFGHVVENTLVNGIEIVRTDITPGPPTGAGLTSTPFDGTTSSATTTVASAIDWNSVRGGFTVGNQVFFGKADGTFWRASFNGSTLGTPVTVQPYHDPKWMTVDTGSGNTFDGKNPSFYAQLPQVGGMFYSGGRIYYNLVGQSQLNWVWFSPDSGIVDGASFTAPTSVSFANVSGMFSSGGFLYAADRSTGDLSRVAFAGGAVTGAATIVNGPSTGGTDWRGRALFLGNPPANAAPTARFTTSCTGLACQFDGSTSADPDGTVASYAWNFGDGTTGTGALASHTYAAAGTRTVALTVTDNLGAVASTSSSVTPVVAPAGTGFIAAVHSTDAKAVTKTLALPAQAQAGDTLLLTYVGNTATPAAPAGWTPVVSASNAFATAVWSKVATAADLGSSVSLNLGTSQKAVAALSVYRGFTSVAAQSATDSATAMHATPAVPVQNGDLVVSLWADKSSTTTSWTSPAGLVQRDVYVGSGNGRYSYLTSDAGDRVTAGTYGSTVAATDAPSTKGISLAIVLHP